MLLIVGGIIQFGIIFWGQNTLTQIVRDTGRWTSTQQQCTDVGPVVDTANALAASSSLIGYSTTSPWTSASVTVEWPPNGSDPCPPANNQQVRFVTITIQHRVPIFFPWVPGNGLLSSSAQFRMEPAAR